MVALMVVIVAAGLGVSLMRNGSPTDGQPNSPVPSVPGSPAPSGPDEGTVVEVTDGDTLVLELGGSEEPVRLIGIDTPESVATDRPDECYGKEASQHLAELLPVGSTVRLERDVEPRDRYDRLLAYVYRSSDGLFVNRDQVANGFAEAKEYPPNTARSGDLEVAETSARNAGTGLWSACGGTDTPVGG